MIIYFFISKFQVLSDTGLINYWNFNNNYLDSVTGYGLTGFFGTWAFVADRNGRALSAVSLSSAGAKAIGGCQPFSSILSVSLWLYTPNANNNCFLTYGGTGQYCYVYASGYIYFVDTSSLTQFAPNVYNQWVHFGFTYSGGTMKFYKNGVFYSSGAVTISAQTEANACWIGGSTLRNAGFIGYLDDVMYFNYVLTDAKMLTVKNYYL